MPKFCSIILALLVTSCFPFACLSTSSAKAGDCSSEKLRFAAIDVCGYTLERLGVEYELKTGKDVAQRQETAAGMLRNALQELRQCSNRRNLEQTVATMAPQLFQDLLTGRETPDPIFSVPENCAKRLRTSDPWLFGG